MRKSITFCKYRIVTVETVLVIVISTGYRALNVCRLIKNYRRLSLTIQNDTNKKSF